jgi:hypothetical protein
MIFPSTTASIVTGVVILSLASTHSHSSPFQWGLRGLEQSSHRVVVHSNRARMVVERNNVSFQRGLVRPSGLVIVNQRKSSSASSSSREGWNGRPNGPSSSFREVWNGRRRHLRTSAKAVVGTGRSHSGKVKPTYKKGRDRSSEQVVGTGRRNRPPLGLALCRRNGCRHNGKPSSKEA